MNVKVNGNSRQTRANGGRSHDSLVPWVRLPAGDEQRGLARDAAVRHSFARSDPLRAVACAARPKRALSQFVNKTHHHLWVVEGVTSSVLLPTGAAL